jgi:RNA polymerase sigma factor (sigma-70 family)
MATSQMSAVLRCLRRAVLPFEGGDLSDGQLLQRFLSVRDEAAFDALLRRHGRMVLGVCRRVLANGADAEDAFQATFLVLVRKAATFAGQGSVGNWLYGVAYRTAQKARVATVRRRVKEKQMARPEATRDPSDPWRELRPIIDEELSRLPDKYRAPVVLCDLEGRTRMEAARRLGCPEGTVSGRLSRARRMLAQRLARRGLALSGGAIATTLAVNAAAARVPATLASTTLHVASLVATGPAAAGAIPASVAALTEGVLKAMSMSKVKLALAAVLAVGLVGAGWGVYQSRAAENAPVNKSAPAVGAPAVGAPAVGAPAPAIVAPAPVQMEGKINLPTGPAPIQVLASIGADGKLIIKMASMRFVPIGPPVVIPPLPAPGALPNVPAVPPGAPVPNAPPIPPGGQAGGAIAAPAIGVGNVRFVAELRAETYDLKDVEVLDTAGKKVTNKRVRQLLKQETVALASMYGQKVDPLHLRVLKDGILIFLLPPPRFVPGVVPPGVPVPLPAPLPPNGGGVLPPGVIVPLPPVQGGAGGAPAGTGVAPPATVVPPIVVPPPTPPTPKQ